MVQTGANVWMTTAALAAGIAVWGAAPAAADDAGYLSHLQDRFSFLSSQQLLAEGHKVCSVMGRGVGASDAVTMVTKDLGVTIAVAADIVAGAADDLGC